MALEGPSKTIIVTPREAPIQAPEPLEPDTRPVEEPARREEEVQV